MPTDSSTYAEIPFAVRNFARNSTAAIFVLDINAYEPLAHVKSRKRNSARPVGAGLRERLGLSGTNGVS